MQEKKKRGLRRYFKALSTKEIKIPSLWIKDGFFSYDKLWIDNYGFRGMNKRKPHIECLIRNYDPLSEEAARLNMPFQIWIWIFEYNGYHDCIILHSPNPFNAFPHKYTIYSCESNFKNKELENLIKKHTGFKRIYLTVSYENDYLSEIQENVCVLYKDGIGEAIL